MSTREPEDPLAREVREHLDRQAAELDATILARLRQGRKAALGSLQARPPVPASWVRPLVAGLSTVALFVMVTALLMQRVPVKEEYRISALEDVEIFSSGEDLEMLENLEFYSWLSEAEFPEKT